VVKGYPDWARRRDIPSVSSAAAVSSASVGRNSELVLVSVSGKGALTGLMLATTGWTSTANVVLKIVIDGETYALYLSGIGAPVVNAGAPFNSKTTPFVVTNIDTTNKKAGISLSVPLRFSSSLEVRYRNEADTATHIVDALLTYELEK
jgi:hypothetical protein